VFRDFRRSSDRPQLCRFCYNKDLHLNNNWRACGKKAPIIFFDRATYKDAMRARKFVYFNAWRKESFGDQQTDIKFISGGSIEVGRYISRIYRAQFLSV